MKTLLSILVLSLIFASCATLNLAGGDGRICSLHNRGMQKSVIRVHYGRTCPERGNTDEYPNAKSIKCMGCIVDSIRYRRAIVWTCKSCTKAKRKHHLMN